MPPKAGGIHFCRPHCKLRGPRTVRSTGWGAGGFGLAGYCQPQDQAVYGLNGAGRRRGRPLRGYAKAFCRGGYQPPAAPTPGQRADVGKPPRIPIASPLTFSPLWDRIMGHDRPDGASTVHTAGTERAPSAESAHGKADGRRPYQRARRRARSPSRTRRTRGSGIAPNMGGTTKAGAFVP